MSEFAEMLRAGMGEVVIPSGEWFLDEPLVLGAFKNGVDGDRWEQQILRASGLTRLIAPAGLPAIQDFSKHNRVRGFEIVGNGAEGIRLGVTTGVYTGNCFSGSDLIIRNCTTGVFNGAFDSSSLNDCIISQCDVGVHSAGNQDTMRLASVSIHKCEETAIKVDKSGKLMTLGGVFGGNRKVVHAGGVDASEAGSVTMICPHFETLLIDLVNPPPDGTPAPAGTPYCEAFWGSRIKIINGTFASSTNLWPAAIGNASCVLEFEGGNPYKPRANGSCQIFASNWMKLECDFNGVANFIASNDWPFA